MVNDLYVVGPTDVSTAFIDFLHITILRINKVQMKSLMDNLEDLFRVASPYIPKFCFFLSFTSSN